jgi:hypothetical protein
MSALPFTVKVVAVEASKLGPAPLTVKLSDQDYDDLERWAKLTHGRGGLGDGTVGGLVDEVLKPTARLQAFIENCRRDEVTLYASAGLPVPRRRP